jgi:hypothetical protein
MTTRSVGCGCPTCSQRTRTERKEKKRKLKNNNKLEGSERGRIVYLAFFPLVVANDRCSQGIVLFFNLSNN